MVFYGYGILYRRKFLMIFYGYGDRSMLKKKFPFGLDRFEGIGPGEWARRRYLEGSWKRENAQRKNEGSGAAEGDGYL